MSRPQQRSLRAWALGISLVVAVGSIGVLAYQAVGLDRSHRAVAEGVLRDYSTCHGPEQDDPRASRVRRVAASQARRGRRSYRRSASGMLVRQLHSGRRILRSGSFNRPPRVHDRERRRQHS
jgi:hypothetical protein